MSATFRIRRFFPVAFRPRLTPESDITASSEFGVSGVVTINDFLSLTAGLAENLPGAELAFKGLDGVAEESETEADRIKAAAEAAFRDQLKLLDA